MPTVLLVRHAQASFGSADYDVLSAQGVEQAGLLAVALARREMNVTRLVAGTARRQRETAAACTSERVPEVDTDARWNEYGTDEIVARHAAATVGLDGTGPGGREITSRQFQATLDGALASWVASGAGSAAAETWPAFFESRAAALADLAAALGSGETGVAFTSGGVIGAICAGLLGNHADLFPGLNKVLVNTGITKLAVGRSGTSLIAFNEHAHIDDGGGALLTYR